MALSVKVVLSFVYLPSVAVVSKDWLLSCKKAKAWLPEKLFLIGQSTAFTEGKPMPALNVSVY
jgi:hypothetical protein